MPAKPVTLALLALAALFAWLSAHSGSPGDAILLIALPLAALLGWPWRFTKQTPALPIITHHSSLIALIPFLLGTAFNSLLLQSLGLTLALGYLLRSQLPASDWQQRRGLLILVALAFPWVSLDIESLGWWFRLSGTSIAAHFFSALGLAVQQQGTQLSIIGLPVTIEPACAGLHSLQAILLVGSALAWTRFGSTPRYIAALAALPLIAWLGNTARIIFICAAALQTSTASVQGLLHEILGWGVLMATFALGWWALSTALDHLPDRPLSPHQQQRWLGLAALAFCAYTARDLALTWQYSPYDLAGAATFLAWATILYRQRPANSCPSVAWLLASIALALLSQATSLHILAHTALALAGSAWLGTPTRSTLALATALAWMPLLGWLAESTSPPIVLALRFTLLLLFFILLSPSPSLIVFPSHSLPLSSSPPLPVRVPLPALGLIAALGLTLLCGDAQLADASERLRALPRSGPSFTCQDIPLAPQELEVFGAASATKQLCTFDGQTAVLLVIDGTRNRHAVHDPRYCFRSAGWDITEDTTQPLPQGGSASHLTLARGQQTAQALYYWTDIQAHHASPLRYWWQTALRRLTAGRSGSEPLLVLLQPTKGSTLTWPHWLAHFPPLQQL